MKKVFYILLSSVFLIASCSKNDDITSDDPADNPKNRIEGVWHMYSYHITTHSGDSLTSDNTIPYSKGQAVYTFKANGTGTLFGSRVDSFAFNYQVINENELHLLGGIYAIEQLTDKKLTLTIEDTYTEDGASYKSKATSYLEKE